ncbi:hypothetical protein ACE4RV_03645 [Acetobacter persici]|uniref:hypothetical protein n=1 Tax=Acetobacter persici TaxID=1076596 RepID=UPI0036DA5891
MATVIELLDKVLSETRACQDRTSPQYQARNKGRYAPFGANIPCKDGHYPTTDDAMSAIAEIADTVRQNDSTLLRAISRDTARKEAAHAIGEILNDLCAEPNPRTRWVMVRKSLKARLNKLPEYLVHYVPVWLFRNQVSPSFSIGPVRFIQRSDWIDVITARRGEVSDWMVETRKIWAGQSRTAARAWNGIKSAARAVQRTPRKPRAWFRAYRSGLAGQTPSKLVAARTVARAVRPDQWVACAEVNGFERDESRRRGLLAVRVALDTVRLLMPRPQRSYLSTSTDSTLPFSVERFSQADRKDLAHGWQLNHLGVGGAPGLAMSIITEGKDVFVAAGSCIAEATNAVPSGHRCPVLADRWFNAVHWFGRACLSDVDFVAVVMLVIALDILSGGLEDQGIAELIARLTGTSISAPVLVDGTDLKKLVERSYKLRSEVAHGSILAVHQTLDIERAKLENLAALALCEYVLRLHVYAQAGGSDDRDDFCNSLPPLVP